MSSGLTAANVEAHDFHLASLRRCVVSDMTITVLQERIRILENTIQAKDAEILFLKEKIEAKNVQIDGCARCGRFATGSYGKHCEECYFAHFFRHSSQ